MSRQDVCAAAERKLCLVSWPVRFVDKTVPKRNTEQNIMVFSTFWIESIKMANGLL